MKEGKSFEMAIKIHLRRLTSVLLCCLLVFCSLPVQVHATDPVTAATLAVTGGQLAGAGLSGEAALSLAGPVGAVVGITLGALGVNAYVSQAAQEAGKTRTRFVLDKLVLWGAQAGYTQERLYSKIAQGISVAADGTIQLGKDASQMVEQFGNWLFTETDAVVPTLSSGNDFTINGFPCVQLQNNVLYHMQGSGGGVLYPQLPSDIPLYAFVTSEGILCAVTTFTGGVVYQTIRSNGSSGIYGTATIGNSYSFGLGNGYVIRGIYYPPGNSNLYFTDIPTLELSWGQCTEQFQGYAPEAGSSYDEVFTGTPEAWAENKDVLNPSADDTPVSLNPDLLNPIIDSLADGQQATMSIIDYLQALQDAWDHALDDVQTAIGTITDSLTGIQEQIAVPQDAVKNPTVTNPSVTPDTTPILNPSDVDPGTAITGLSFDLTNIFPFCIPFDIYAALNLLDAEPVAPSYHFHLEWPYNIVIDFTLDLSPFDQVAAVARTMESLIFLIGLAVMTRSLFIRG